MDTKFYLFYLRKDTIPEMKAHLAQCQPLQALARQMGGVTFGAKKNDYSYYYTGKFKKPTPRRFSLAEGLYRQRYPSGMYSCWPQ